MEIIVSVIICHVSLECNFVLAITMGNTQN